MFTGLVEEKGRLMSIQSQARGARVQVGCEEVLEGTKLGDSICTNGVCLTVTSLGPGYFTADLMEVTLKKAGFDRLRPGSPLNLERALRLQDRLGGHILQGHVDDTGRVLSREEDQGAFLLEVGIDPSQAKYIIDQGSIGLNGVSLTIAEAKEASLVVSLIPETLGRTNLLDLKPGDPCTVEFDVLAKYVEKQVNFKDKARPSSGISREFLLENGF